MNRRFGWSNSIAILFHLLAPSKPHDGTMNGYRCLSETRKYFTDTLLLDRTEKKATRTAGDPLSDFWVCLLLRELGAYFFTILINDNFLNSATTVDPHVFLIPTG